MTTLENLALSCQGHITIKSKIYSHIDKLLQILLDKISVIPKNQYFGQFFEDALKMGCFGNEVFGIPETTSKLSELLKNVHDETFTSRKWGIGSFRLTGAIHVTATHIQLPRVGTLRLKESGYLPMTAKILSATISERAGRWFVSLLVEEERPKIVQQQAACGVDVGISALATLDDGTQFANPNAIAHAQEQLHRTQRRVSRKVTGRQNRKKAVRRVARLHYRVSCIRKDAIHKATTTITKSFGVIGIEGLHVAGMVKNHHLAGAVSDASFAEFHRQLTYKTAWRGGQVVKGDRFYPSSKTCSVCGTKKTSLKRSDRLFDCEACGASMNRDVNASKNIKHTVSSTGINACGDGRLQASASARRGRRKKTPGKAEVLFG